MVPVDSDGISPVPPYSGYHYHYITLPVRDSHPLWFTFPGNSCSVMQQMSWSYNPGAAVTTPVWAVSRSLATTWEITVVFSSSGYLDVSVPRVRLPLQEWYRFTIPGCPIRKSPDQKLFAPPRGLSQLTTSFVASLCQGIHRMPFVA